MTSDALTPQKNAEQAYYLCLQCDDGFLEGRALYSIKDVGVAHIGTRPEIIMLADGDMATSVICIRGEGDVEVSRHDLVRIEHKAPPQRASAQSTLVPVIGVFPTGKYGKAACTRSSA